MFSKIEGRKLLLNNIAKNPPDKKKHFVNKDSIPRIEYPLALFKCKNVPLFNVSHTETYKNLSPPRPNFDPLSSGDKTQYIRG